MPPERDDWPELKAEYVTGSMSCRELAEKHGVPYYTIRSRSTKERWGDERKKHRSKLVDATLKKATSRRTSACVKQLASVAKSAELATKAIERTMTDREQFQRHLVQVRDAEGAQDVQERVYAKMDTKALRELTAAMKDLVAVIRDVNGLPTLQEQKAMELARDRLDLEREKAAMADDVDEDETGVVILPPVMEDEDASNSIGGGPQADQADADSVEPSA